MAAIQAGVTTVDAAITTGGGAGITAAGEYHPRSMLFQKRPPRLAHADRSRLSALLHAHSGDGSQNFTGLTGTIALVPGFPDAPAPGANPELAPAQAPQSRAGAFIIRRKAKASVKAPPNKLFVRARRA